MNACDLEQKYVVSHVANGQRAQHTRIMTLAVRVQVENNWKKWGRSKEDVGRRGHVRISRNDGGWGVREQHGVEARDNYC